MKKLPDIHEDDRNIPGIPGTDKATVPPDKAGDTSVAENLPDDSKQGNEDSGVELQPDGSAIVKIAGENDTPKSTGFLDNLADVFDEGDLRKFANRYIELIERDKEARKRRDAQYEEGLRRTGLGADAPGGAGFQGSSKVVHPILAEACVDFASRAMKELFPPSGPVRTNIVGKESEVKVELANRKARFMNWQMTTKIQEYRTEQEQLLTQLPMGGSQYQKFWYNERFKRPGTEFVPIDDLLMPFAASYFYTANRITHVQHITEFEYDERIQSGLYRDTGIFSVPGTIPDQTKSAEANDKIEGREPDAYNEDGLRDIFEIYTWYKWDDDDITEGETAPYIVTVDAYTEKVLAVYRNWEEGDESLEKLDWIVEWKFIPWRGAYGIGLPHLIGGISAALTGALRALLDSAHINNSASLIKLKGGKMSGQNIVVEPTQISEIEGPAGADDIRKVMMSMPYNPPSPVLFQLLDWLTNAGKSIVASSAEALDQVGDRTPVGTTMAMVEQNSSTYSSIHSRLHFSQAKALSILCRINKNFLDDEMVIEELGDLLISRHDFKNSVDIIPISDPNIFSETQRYAQIQGISQVKQLFPTLPFNDNAIARRMLLRMRIENIDEILPEPKKPQNLNPVAENIAAMHGSPILAMPKQNHLAHMYCHLEFILSPIFSDPSMSRKAAPGILEHMTQHIGFYYADEMNKATQFNEKADKVPTTKMEDEMAHAHSPIMTHVQTVLKPIMQQMAQLQMLVQKLTPQPPADPAIEATLQAAMAEINRKKALDSANINLKTQEITQIKPAMEKMKQDVVLIKNQQQTTEHQETEVLKNTGDNQTAQFIAALKLHMDDLTNKFQAQIDSLTQQSEQMHQQNVERIGQETQLALGAQQQQGAQVQQGQQTGADQQAQLAQQQHEQQMQASQPQPDQGAQQ